MKIKRKKYGFVVKVEERVLYSTLVESDEKLPWSRLKAIAESRRVKGDLSLEGVLDVDSWCEGVYVGGVPCVNRKRRGEGMNFRPITNIFILDTTIKELKRLGIIKEKHKRKKA